MERNPTLPSDPLRLIAGELFSLTRENLARSRGRDLINFCLTNRRLNEVLCGSPDFWRFLYYRDLSDKPPKDRDFKKAYLEFYRETRNIPKYESLKIGASLGYEKIVLSILREINPKNEPYYYNQAMRAASREGHKEIVNLMLKLGANDYNLTMATAAAVGQREIVDLMLKLGATDYNWSLAWAAGGKQGTRGQREIVDLMLTLGANNYDLAMDAAARGGHPEIVDCLRQWTETHHGRSDWNERLLSLPSYISDDELLPDPGKVN